MYKWNIRDLQLSKNAEIGLLQITNNRATLTDERPYPPKQYNSFTEPTLVSYLGQLAVRETITLTTANISYGSGTYEIHSSSIYGQGLNRNLLFNYVLNETGSGWAYDVYSRTTGLYLYTNKYIIDGYYGDWVIIKLPSPIILTKFTFWARSGLINRSPGLWRCYGSNDDINYEEIPNASNDVISLTTSSYVNNIYEKVVNNNTKSYLYYGFVVRKLADIGTTSDMLNFNELRLFGREEIKLLSEERQYPPKIWDTIEPSITTITYNGFNAFRTNFSLFYNNITYGGGTYTITYSTRFVLTGPGFFGCPAENLFNHLIDTTNYNQTANFLDNTIIGFDNSGNYIGERFLGETSYKGLWFF
jgi:hypothetical protein